MARNQPVDVADVIIAGAGPAGLATGLACAHLGLDAIVIGPAFNAADTRTAALFRSSILFLDRIGAWEHAAGSAEKIGAIRLADQTGGFVRAPEVTFHASEIGLDAFGFNVANAALTGALEKAAAGRLRRVVSQGVRRVETTGDRVRVETAEGQALEAPLVAGADGRNSMIRQVAAIQSSTWAYDQTAIVCAFAHSRPHEGISTELHRRAGPLTVVPMPGNVSSLVWVETPVEAGRLVQLDDGGFLRVLASHLSGLLGTLREPSPRRMFPLSGLTAKVFAKNRMALVGEAGHVMPPIGAQGLNLSLRDAATLAELAAAARERNADIGADDVLAGYERRRRPDAASRQWTIDVMNRSLLSEYAPVHLARGFGLTALKTFAPLRHLVMREGVTSSFWTPRLMLEDRDTATLDGRAMEPASRPGDNSRKSPPPA